MSKKHVDLLSLVANDLKTTNCCFICHSLHNNRRGYEKESVQIKQWIDDALDNCFTYGDWLEKNHPEVYEKYYTKASYTFEARLQWVNWMINNHTIFDNVKVH